jgi:hypothetical protein
MKFTNKKVVGMSDFNDLVRTTYGKPYHIQQQDGCKPRRMEYFSVPVEYPEDYENDTVPEIVNHSEMGVSFKAWLERDPKQKLPNREDDFGLHLWWERNFYPTLDMVIQDLHSKGLIEPGEYAIDIDW